MPRGIRGSTDYSALIQKLDDQISKCNKRLTSLKEQRQNLLAKKQETDMHDLYSYMVENNLSTSEVIAQLIPSIAASTSLNSTEV